jgi:hypothetical protein
MEVQYQNFLPSKSCTTTFVCDQFLNTYEKCSAEDSQARRQGTRGPASCVLALKVYAFRSLVPTQCGAEMLPVHPSLLVTATKQVPHGPPTRQQR